MSLNYSVNYASNNDVVYTPQFYKAEGCFISDFGRYIRNAEDFNRKFNNFISNLPADSVRLAERIFERIEKVFSDKDFEQIDLFSEEEKQNIYSNYSLNHIRRYKNAAEYGGIVFPDFIEFELWTCIYKSGFYFLKNKDFKNAVIFDVGGYVGDSSLFIQKYTGATVYAFEPNPKNFELMKIVLRANNNKNILPFPLAFGEEVSKKQFYDRGIMSSFLPDGKKSENIREVDITTLDIFSLNNKMVPNVIKIDVEGVEALVLKGAEETIKKHKPILLISVYHNIEEFFSIKSQIESLDSGYKFRLLKPDDNLILRKTTLLAYPC